MKKYLATIILVIAMLAMFTGTVAAAGSAQLVSVVYVPGKGPVFTFTVSGNFSKADLKGLVQVDGGGNFDLYCTKVDSSTVTCTTSKKAAGKDVMVTWGGGTFWASVPAAKDSPSPVYCYAIWDWWDFTGNQWTNFGPYCQSTPAQAGDIISYTVPDPNGSFDSSAEFFDVDVSTYCDPPVPYDGPAYYYPGCPF